MRLKSLITVLLFSCTALIASEPSEGEETAVVAASSKKRKHEVEPLKNEHITEMGLSHERELTNIDFLIYFPNLRELNLELCVNLGDRYHTVSELRKLEKLNISSIYLSTALHVRALTNLTSLDVSLNYLDTVADIVQLSNLTDLNLAGCYRIKDLDLLAHLTKLKKLNISQLLIDDDVDYPESLDFLASLINLRKLNISGNCYVSKIAPLATLPRLTNLDVSLNRCVQDWGSLSSLTTLKRLNISGLRVYKEAVDLSFLPDLIHLKKLTVGQWTELPELPDSVEIKVAKLETKTSITVRIRARVADIDKDGAYIDHGKHTFDICSSYLRTPHNPIQPQINHLLGVERVKH